MTSREAIKHLYDENYYANSVLHKANGKSLECAEFLLETITAIEKIKPFINKRK